MSIMGLSARQLAFVEEFLLDNNGTQAAIRAGYSPANSGKAAFEMLANPKILEAIDHRVRDIAQAKSVTPEWIVSQWKMIASADPTDACYVRVECCRHCYGIGGNYQFDEQEYKLLVAAAASHTCGKNCSEPCGKKFPPLALGGFGYSPVNPPVPECPNCHGDGLSRVIVRDSKSLTGPVRRLIAGVKQTKDGIELKFRDQDRALENLAKFLGLMIERKELSGPGGSPIAIENLVSAKDLTDDQLAQFLAKRVESV